MDGKVQRKWLLLLIAVGALACSPVSGATGAESTIQAAGSQVAGAETLAAAAASQQPAPAGGGAVNTPAPAGGAAATPSPEATEAQPTATPTYDAIAAQLTVQPLLTANAATATLASGGLRQWAAAAQASSEYGKTDYAAVHAVGTPDYYPQCGDNGAAWASANSTGPATLTLVYTTPVVPVAVNIYETNAPGSIVEVDVVEVGGASHKVYAGLPLVSQVCPRIFGVPVTGVTGKVNKVVVQLDQTVVGTWNEIDAVELVGNP